MYLEDSVPPALAEPAGPRAVSGKPTTHGITILSDSVDDQFADIRQRIRAIEDEYPAIRGYLVTARDLLMAAEGKLAAAAEDSPRC